MKNLKLFSLALISVLLIAANMWNAAIFDGIGMERQEQQRHDRTEGQERYIEIDQLPQSVLTTLQEDYKDWNPSEAFIASDPESGAFYKVTLNKPAGGEIKIVKIAIDGAVLDEEEIEKENSRREGYRGRTVFV
jgi:hypothetical protein